MEAFLKGGTLKDAKKEKTDKAETSGTKLKGKIRHIPWVEKY